MTRRVGIWPQVIAKIGGTSVGKFLDVIATDIVPSAINSKHRIAIVCSARSGATKATGTTNLLLRAALETLRPRANDLASSISSFNTPAGTPGPASADKLNPLTSQIFQRSASQAPLNGDSKPGSTRSGSSTPGGSLAASLLGLRGAEEGPQQFNATVDQIKHDHVEAARLAVKDAAILAELEDDLDYDCERLRSFLLAAQVSTTLSREMAHTQEHVLIENLVFVVQIIDEISTRSKDIIMGVGERLSCRIVTAVLRDRVSCSPPRSDPALCSPLTYLVSSRESTPSWSRSRTLSRPRRTRTGRTVRAAVATRSSARPSTTASPSGSATASLSAETGFRS